MPRTRPTPQMTSGGPLLDDLLCFDLYAASRAVTAVYRPLLEQQGLTYPQYLVLSVLLRGGPCAIRDVGTTLRLDHGTLTPLLRRLEDRGLVVRQPGADARSVIVALSARGEALRLVLDDVRCAVGAALGIDEDEVHALQATLRRIAG